MQAAFCAGVCASWVTEIKIMGNHKLAFFIKVTGNPAVGKEVCACSMSVCACWYPQQYNI